jgi:arylsulfatase A
MNKLVLISAIPLGFSSISSAQSREKPNIVFILTDDLGWTDLGCYGNPYNETPIIDSLAAKGIRFTQSYAACPVSSPSRAALLTGKYPARLQITNFLVGNKTDPQSPVLPAKWKPYLEARETTLAELLKSHGYITGLVGKWHLGGHDSIAPWGQGFDYTRMIGKNGLDYYNYSIYEDSYQKQFIDSGKNYLTDKLTDYGVEFIEKYKNKQFFLYLAYSAPHVYSVPRGDKLKKYFNKYEKFAGKYNPNYAAMIESIDDGVGAIINTLKKEGILDNTLIIFTSDNGGLGLPELGPTPTHLDPLKKWKGHIYEGGLRVPTILYWSNHIPSGQVCNKYFTNIDYLPTFSEMLEIKDLPANLDGKSFYPLIKNPADSTFNRGPIFWHYPHFSNQLGRPAGAVRSGDYKLVENYETHTLELYNLKTDEGETIDLSEKLKDKTHELYNLLKTWRTSVNAQMPVPNPAYKNH